MKIHSPFRSTAPSRFRAASLAAVCFGIAVFAYVIGSQTAAWLFGLIFLPCGVVFSLAALVPDRFLLGVRLGASEFEYRAPLRRPKVIFFNAIQSIDAVCRGDGGAGDDVHWLIASTTGKVFIPEHELLTSGLSKAIERVLTLEPTALKQAYSYQPHGLDFVFGKRFRIYGDRQA